ncbi:MAG: DUF484 family protein [Paracoccus sp. (in: a-proteobacteria)]|uniref:DUF484 family protein n=1 Tax=Paracoccus sp. TaxID=267 RepID=UPI0039E6303F
MAQDAVPNLPEDLRARLLGQPELILADRELMRALIGARDATLGENVVDIRGLAMQALEARLDRLEATHESVISTAYENQTGMNTVHRAVLSLLEPLDFEAFLDNLESNVAPILRIETLRLIMASDSAEQPPRISGPLRIVPTATMAELIAGGRRAPRADDIILRGVAPQTLPLHGEARAPIRSEALLPIELGPGRFPALLLMGSTEQARFSPAQGTDLLRFFAQVFRLVLIGWLRE